MKNITVKDKRFKPFISEAQIQQRIKEIARGLDQQFSVEANKVPIMIGILNGAFMFFSDIIKAINFDCEIAFTKISSYRGTSSIGKINIELPLKKDIKNRHVVIIEDIVDTGRTMKEFLEILHRSSPTSVTLVTLLHKPDALKFPVKIDYTGFIIENKFVVGYGLDYDQLGRQHSSIYQLVENTEPTTEHTSSN